VDKPDGVALPPDQWTPEMVRAFNSMTVCRVKPLTDAEMAELREALASVPSGHITLMPPEIGPVGHVGMVRAMQGHLNRIGGERAALARQVADLQRENRSLADDVRDARRRHALALESVAVLADSLAKAEAEARLAREAYQVPLPLEQWHEGIGPVLWWFFPVEEAPWCGGPQDSDWPGYHTHWTPLPGVAQPDGTPAQPTPMPARPGARRPALCAESQAGPGIGGAAQ
jgi:hypothetical protein